MQKNKFQLKQSESPKEMMNSSTQATGSISLTVLNPAIENLPQIYVGTEATLNVTLSNNTGSDVQLEQDSTLEIYMPFYFSTEEVGDMNIDSISMTGWNFSHAGDGGLLLSYTSNNGVFPAGSVLSFNISSVSSNASPASDTVQINFSNMNGANVPSQVTVTLGLLAAPVSGNANLNDTLEVNFNDEQIFVSVASDPISNTLYLNFKNTGNTPLYNGKSMWQGNPKVAITFAYGNTSGAVAPDTKSAIPALGSAWNIDASVSVDQTAGWQVSNPSPSGDSNSPVWILSPVSSNQEIIGIDTNANVTFAFSNIYSFTPQGSTQMYVQFSGFRKDENTLYNDAVLVVDIDKESNPSRGLQILSSQTPYCYTSAINGAAGSTVVGLGWQSQYVGKVVLQYVILNRTTPAPPSPFSKTYPNNNSPEFDSTVLTIDGVIVGDQLQFTMYAYETDGVTEINSKQFSVTVEQQADAYSFTGPGSTVPYNINQVATFSLNWKVFDAVSIKISSTFAGITPYQKTYATPNQWNPDSYTFNVSNLDTNVTIPFTLEAFDENGALLNSMSLSVSCIVAGWCDPKDSKVYAVVTLNNQLWLSQNYDYNMWANQQPGPSDTPDGIFYSDDPAYEVPYGMYYQYSTALTIAPAGWRLASDTDWQGLFAIYGTQANGRYMPGGDTGLNLQAGGACSAETLNFGGLGIVGAYWSQASDPTQCGFVSLLDGQISVGDAPIVNLIYLANVRYIKNS